MQTIIRILNIEVYGKIQSNAEYHSSDACTSKIISCPGYLEQIIKCSENFC